MGGSGETRQLFPQEGNLPFQVTVGRQKGGKTRRRRRNRRGGEGKKIFQKVQRINLTQAGEEAGVCVGWGAGEGGVPLLE